MTKQEVEELITGKPYNYSKILKTHHLDIFNEIDSLYGSEFKFAEKAWAYISGCTLPQSCECGKRLIFINVLNGYPERCKKCSDKNKRESSEHFKKVSQQPTEAPTCLLSGCSKKVYKKTNGMWSLHCSWSCKSIYNMSNEDVINKTISTNRQKYGSDYAIGTKQVREKIRDTFKEKYGSESPPGKKV